VDWQKAGTPAPPGPARRRRRSRDTRRSPYALPTGQLVAIQESQLVLAQMLIGDAFLEIGIDQVRPQSERLIEVLDRPLMLLQLGGVDFSPTAESFRVVWLKTNGLIEVLDGRLRLAHFTPNDPTGQQGFRVVRLEDKSLVEICQRLVVLTDVGVCVCAEHVGLAKLRLAAYGQVKVLNGALMFAQNQRIDRAPFLVGFRKIGLQLDGSVKIPNGFLVVAQT